MRTTLLRLFTASLLVASLAACGDDDNDDTTDTGNGQTQTDTGNGQTDTGNGDDTGGGEAVTMEDTTFRITGLSIIKPAGVGAVLGAMMKTDINNQALHIMIQFTDFSGPWPADVQIAGNAGQVIYDGDDIVGYDWYPGIEPEFVAGHVAADGHFSTDNTLSIVFPALEPGATEPLMIPISDLALDVDLFEENGQWLMEGDLAGAILKDDIEGIVINLGEPKELAEVLGLDKMDYPVGAAAGERTGWRIQAEIEAEAVNFVAAD